MEFVDLYDNHRNKTGRVIQRREKIPKGFFRLIIHVCLFNLEDKMLIQKRSKKKNSFANLWDLTVSGAVSKGEDTQTSASRELMEELSIKHNFVDAYPNLSIKSDKRIDDVFIIKKANINIDNLNLQKEEVSEVRWASLETIKKMIENKEFVPYNPDYINILFYLKDNKSLFTCK